MTADIEADMRARWAAAVARVAAGEERAWTAQDVAVSEVEAPLPDEPDGVTLDRRSQDWIEATYR